MITHLQFTCPNSCQPRKREIDQKMRTFRKRPRHSHSTRNKQPGSELKDGARQLVNYNNLLGIEAITRGITGHQPSMSFKISKKKAAANLEVSLYRWILFICLYITC